MANSTPVKVPPAAGPVRRTPDRPPFQPTLSRAATLQRNLQAPGAASPSQVLSLQRSIGNRAVQRLLSPAPVQREPVVGPEGGEVGPEVQDQLARASAGGRPLDSSVGAKVGGALGADFSSVRVHTDSEADALNHSLGAQAFTHGSDIFFSRGAYNPGSSGGQRLLAHELTHVVQQGGGKANKVQTKLQVGPADDSYEREADRVADQLLSGLAGPPAGRLGAEPPQPIQAKRAAPGVIQRSIFTQMRVSMYGQKAGKTLQEVTNPRKPVSNAFKQFAAAQGAQVELKFLRELNALLAKAVNGNKVDRFLTKYHGRLPGLDYSSSFAPDGQFVESQLKKFVRLKTEKNMPITAEWLRAAMGEFKRGAERKVEAAVHAYNAAHNRLAAPGAGGWNVIEQNVFTSHGVAPTQYVTSKQSTAPSKLGAGGVNTVYKHQYQGETGEQVFKEDMEFDVAAGLHPGTVEGIPEQNPEFAKRSVAMSRLAEALGVSVIAKTAFAVSDGRFGTVQTMAKGKAMEKLTKAEKDAIANDPNFQRALSQLQLIDIIAGQLDRHQGNYFIELDSSGNFVALKGIDLDLAFGKSTTAMSGKFKAGTLGPGAKQIKKFDSGFVDVLIALDPKVIRDALAGLLSDEEIDATVQRFTDLRDYLVEVKAGRKVGQSVF